MSDRAVFAAVAPRLERAHRERRAEVRREARDRRRQRELVLKLERLVAHRELQLQRAGWVGRYRYYDMRLAKLQAAERALLHARRRAEEIGA